jgi:hypothetical protein
MIIHVLTDIKKSKNFIRRKKIQTIMMSEYEFSIIDEC